MYVPDKVKVGFNNRSNTEVYALWNPEKTNGGTYDTITKAEKLNKPVTNFWV